MNGLLYWRTIRYLKLEQILGRLSFGLKKRLLKPLILHSVKQRAVHKELPAPGLKKRCFSASALQNLEQQEFKFLSVTARFKKNILWNDPQKPKLWLYNLHYFEYLLPITHQVNEANFKLAQNIIEDWQQNNPIGQGNGWEPYPISLRVVNWIFFYDAYYEFFKKEDRFATNFLNSLYQQVAYLTFFLEKHLQANHLWANVKTLLFTGLFFEEQKWIEQGMKQVQRELKEQILADGGHYERSPMYHALILMDLIDLLNLLQAKEKRNGSLPQNLQKLQSTLVNKVNRMWHWLQTITQPDGELPLLGDTALGIVPTTRQIGTYLKAVLGESVNETKLESAAFTQSGYFIFRDEKRYLVIDGGQLGVDYQPGHAHCDFLSYELSIQDKRIVVDAGVGEYLPTELRQKARSIYSHNTLVINKMEQAELWSAFRMGRRVQPQKVKLKTEPDFEFLGAYYNNLNKHLSYWHQRKIKVAEYIEIEDQWLAKKLISVENLIHLHPDCKVELNDGQILIKRDEVEICLLYDYSKVKAELREWFYVPEFGKVLPTKVLVLLPEPGLGEMFYSIQFF